MWRAETLEKTLLLGRIEGRRRRGRQRMRWWMASLTQWIWDWVNSRNWWWTGRLACYSPWGCKSRTRLRDWTEMNWTELRCGTETRGSGYRIKGRTRSEWLPRSQSSKTRELSTGCMHKAFCTWSTAWRDLWQPYSELFWWNVGVGKCLSHRQVKWAVTTKNLGRTLSVLHRK